MSRNDLYVGPITRPEELYRKWCVELNVIEELHG